MKSLEKGNILIADPSMIGDMIFSRSIVLLTDFNIEGAVGFVLNKPSKFFLNSFFDGIRNIFRIYIGGPVEGDSLYYIHKRPDLISNSSRITKNIYWGGDFTNIIELLQQDKIKPDEIKFFLGYSGWTEHQLEDEVEMNAWAVLEDGISEKIFSNHRISLWRECLKKLGNDYIIWANTPENPQYN